MVSKGDFTRIDIGEVKALIYEKIGHKKAEIYFNLLSRLFNSKISKSEFDKLCIRTVGRENLSLHNRLIRSIVKNTSLSKVPPPKVTKPNDPLKSKIPNGYPKKIRSLRDCKFRERPSPLGPLGKTRSPTLDQSPTELNSIGSSGEEVEQGPAGSSFHSKSPITAPIGVSLNFGGGSRKNNIFNYSENNLCTNTMTCQSSCELPDNTSLRAQIEQRLLSSGVGVSEDFLNCLNTGLNVYLKRLIEPGMRLARSRSGFRDNLSGSRVQTRMSMLDLRVSVESNPRILGGDWPIQLEKICSLTNEE